MGDWGRGKGEGRGGEREGRSGSALFSFHIDSGFLRDGSSICQGIGPLIIFSNRMLEIRAIQVFPSYFNLKRHFHKNLIS